ncbi:hypothetical protein P2318_28930 [Myxococcaceae bacterium GXIMD 01537]
MGRIILFILAIGVVAGVAYYATQPAGTTSAQPAGQDPAQRLENVRAAAKEIEAEQQKHLDETYQKALETGAR